MYASSGNKPFSQNHVIVRLTNTMDNLLEHLKIFTFKVIFYVKNWLNLSEKEFYEEYLTRRPTFIIKYFVFEILFSRYFITQNRAQFLLALFIILVSLTMATFCEKMLISTRCVQYTRFHVQLDQKILNSPSTYFSFCHLFLTKQYWGTKAPSHPS